jgi:hypothetical protein
MIEQSKTCTELGRGIENLKSLGDTAQRAGESGQGDQVIRGEWQVSSDKWIGIGKKT